MSTTPEMRRPTPREGNRPALTAHMRKYDPAPARSTSRRSTGTDAFRLALVSLTRDEFCEWISRHGGDGT